MAGGRSQIIRGQVAAAVFGEPCRRGPLDGYEIGFANRMLNLRPGCYQAVANMLGRSEADVRRIMDPAWALSQTTTDARHG